MPELQMQWHRISHRLASSFQSLKASISMFQPSSVSATIPTMPPPTSPTRSVFVTCESISRSSEVEAKTIDVRIKESEVIPRLRNKRLKKTSRSCSDGGSPHLFQSLDGAAIAFHFSTLQDAFLVGWMETTWQISENTIHDQLRSLGCRVPQIVVTPAEESDGLAEESCRIPTQSFYGPHLCAPPLFISTGRYPSDDEISELQCKKWRCLRQHFPPAGVWSRQRANRHTSLDDDESAWALTSQDIWSSASRAAAQAWAFTAPYRAYPEYEESIREEQTYNPWDAFEHEYEAVSPPPNDDSWASENATPQVQDCAFGDALVVPPSGSGYVRYANVPMGHQFSSDSDDYYSEYYEGGVPELATSDEDSPTTDGGRASLCFGEDLDLYFQGSQPTQPYTRHHSEEKDHGGLATATPCRWEGPKFTLGTFSDDDDEEDGPPPITDDWFVDLAKRSVGVAAVLERAREQGS